MTRVPAAVIAFALLVAVTGACWGQETPPLPTPATPGPTEAAAADALRRPLALPAGGCPVTSDERELSAGLAPGFGPGPIYPTDNNIEMGRQDSGLYAGKILWLGDETYDGPALVRGQRIDGGDGVLFRTDAGLVEELVLRAGGSAWSPGVPEAISQWPSGIVVRSGGCYAFQIDGEGFSTVLVLRVRT